MIFNELEPRPSHNLTAPPIVVSVLSHTTLLTPLGEYIPVCDVVVLSPSVPAVQGQVAVARIANQIGVTCKLIRFSDKHVHLIPINERYETRIIDKNDLTWALAVICHISL